MRNSEETHGFTVRPDGKPLRTKVVATIGDPERYPDGAVDLDGREIDAGRLDYRRLVDGFRRHGADVIRLNLSHIPAPEQARQVLRSIKAAILESERRDPQLKRIAILADLPGPKIRFDIDPGLRLKVGDELTIAFDRERSSGDVQAVFVDDSPLRTAMHRIDDLRDKLGSYSPEADAEEPDGEQLEIAANILGYPVATARARRRLFDSLMDKITRRLDAGDKVLVFIGEAEAVLEVDGGAFDPREPLLPCRVSTVRQPEIKGRKGFTIKGIDIDIPTFTKQDQILLDALLKEDCLAAEDSEPVVAFIGLSFAQTADDVLRARQFIEDRLIRRLDRSPEEARLEAPLIIAKIETNRGWENRRYILDAADGVMVARGDLGLQVDVEKVPEIQKRLITLCNKRGKPVITATQMLTSMTASVEPTRAEVSDVFNAIQDGTDAVMLSEETAVGRFPFHALRKMTDIAKRAESYFELDGIADESLRIELRRKRIMDFLRDDHLRIARDRERLQASLAYVGKGWGQLRRDKEKQLRRLEWRRRLYLEKLDRIQEQLATNRITEATCTMAEVKVVSAVVAATTSGRTVRMISRLRSRVATIGAAHDPLNARKLAVSYGVVPICVGDIADEQRFDYLFRLCEDRILGHDYLKKILAEATVIFIGGLPLQTSGATNMLQIRRISAAEDPRRPRPA
jgi:pyruvate kinase